MREKYPNGGTGWMKDLYTSIELSRSAIALTPEAHRGSAGRANNLGIILKIRFPPIELLEDIDTSIELGKIAVVLISDEDPEKVMTVQNQHNVLGSRFRKMELIEDLNESIEVWRQAIALTPDNHSDMAERANNLRMNCITDSNGEKYGCSRTMGIFWYQSYHFTS